MDFKNIPKKYRPIPFWSWNEKLDINETKSQIEAMDKAGIGGFFMHARGGLQTEYMGEDWFLNVETAVKTSKELGMGAWAYDENGWPSGFGGGKVNGLGVSYQQKYLRMEDTKQHSETEITKCGNHYFYYEVNPFYVDTLDKKVTEKFIELIYEPYYKRFKNEFEGFFTDEPQISRNGIPWSFVYEEEYKKRYGENILEHLEELFLPVADFKNTRVKFWTMVTELFSENFCKTIYEWCDKRGLKFTGHLVCEETLSSQLVSNGACMPHYEYFHVPGMDWLGRDIYKHLTVPQLASAAEQLGKKSVLSETFALCGHNVSFAELKGIFEWQMSGGVNLLCQHLEGYSNRGLRKRDFPPAMYIQQPWWEEYEKFNTAMSREGMILAESEKCVDVLVLHPQTTAWTLYDNGKCEGLKELNDRFIDTLDVLAKKHIQYHLGDETLIKRHARIENGKFVIGNCKYSYIVDPGCEILMQKTRELLDEFLSSGGKMLTVEELPDNNFTDNPEITYSLRQGDGYRVHYFVNTSPDEKKANIFAKGKKLDIYSGDLLPFSGVHTFEPWGSLMIIEDGSENIHYEEKKEDFVYLDGEFEVFGEVENALTLDRCDYYFDGELQDKNAFVLNILHRANKLKREVKIHQDYHVNVEFIPDKLYLVCETPENFDIFVNGTEIEKNIDGYFRDKSFKKIEISKYMKMGENTISFDGLFSQSPEVYENIEKAAKFESEKNKLYYDMEIEAIYLVGDFGVKTDGKWSELERNAMRYRGEFVISEPVKKISLQNIEKQGYAFFSDKMTVLGEIDIKGENPVLCLRRKGINVVKIEIGGKESTLITNDKLSLLGLSGKTKVKVTLINNLRNLLGPHHLEVGESYQVSPAIFYEEPCIWNDGGWGYNPEKDWNSDYCFVQTSL